MILHGYFRSAASWRVRIALNLKRVAVQHVFHHLRRGEQRSSEYLALNPQGLVPTLAMEDGTPLTQSLAIIEWLDEVHPDPPLLPGDATRRAAVRALPSRPGESHPEPLTDPDLTLSRHPARATERRLPPSAENWSSSCCQLARSQRR